MQRGGEIMKKSKFNSIKTKMMINIGLLLIVMFSGLGVVSYYNASKTLVSSVQNNLTKIAEEGARVVGSRIEGSLNVLQAVANSKEIKDANVPWDTKAAILSNEASNMSYLKIGIADLNGDIKYTDGKTGNIKDRAYYSKVLNGNKVVSDPLISTVDNKFVYVYAVPIKENNAVIAVLVATREATKLSEVTNDITIGKTGKAYMLKGDATVIAHSDPEKVIKMYNAIKEGEKDTKLKDLVDIQKRMIAGENSYGDYTYAGIKKYVGFSTVPGTTWSLGVAVDSSEVLSGLNSLKISMIVYSLIFLIVAMLVVFVLASGITKTLKLVVKHLEKMSAGDLSEEVDNRFTKLKDEIGDMARALSIMQSSLKSMIIKIKNNSVNIDSQSENLASVSEEMSSATENVSSAIQDVARATGGQAEDLVDITQVINNFGIEIGNIVKAINEVEVNSMGINSLANDSNGSMESLMTSVTKVAASFKEFSDKITALGENVIKINGITNLINSIADQTNLLALNAAIEAARAGEAGRGFSVVADEIRKLAEQSKESSENINKLISGISSDTNVIVGSTDMMSAELATQVTVINEAIESFKRITSAVEEVIPKIEAVNNSAVNIEGKKDEILAKVEDASAVAEEVAASSEEITASSEEMNASSEEVAATAQNLSSMTKEMMEEVGKFKI
jgi:methyl-accepting chemotaxis protein